MPPVQPEPLLIQLLLNPDQNIIMEQLPFLPGYEQVQAGQPLNQDQFRRFRSYLFKTIHLHRERHSSRVQLTKLYHRTKVEKWIHQFAPFSPGLIEALLPFIKISCYSFTWPYAELWHLADTPGARNIKIVRTFCYAYDRWVIVEPVIARLDAYMQARTITLPSREIPGDAFTSQRPSWDIDCINSCPDKIRAKLMKEAFIEKAFVMPLKEGLPGTVSHVLVFYGKPPSGYTFSGPKRFVEYASQYIKHCYGTVEMIGEDEGDDIMEEGQERGAFSALRGPGIGAAKLHSRLRRSQSLAHNLCNVDRGL